jgi:GTP-binding protein
MFLDEVTIDVTGGAGGRGCVSWRREKYVPKGGPDGGDGGQGGDIILLADVNTDTLTDFLAKKRFEASKGQFGMGKNKRGKDGEPLVLTVPTGTIVSEVTAEGLVPFADLAHAGDQVVVAQGGRGGYGNAHFVSSVRQRPDFAELGEPGEHRTLKLELKLIADVGIIGYPNVGKSTLISVVSAARPKIANYPFTTLVPNLGVVSVGERSFVVCDVPGLIEGASEGKGLGHTFLKHIERCGVLLHVLDIGRGLKEGGDVDVDALTKDYETIRKELAAHSPALAAKRELVILNKTDLIPEGVKTLRAALKKKNITVFADISAATNHGTDDLMKELLPIVLEERGKRVAGDEEPSDDVLPVLRPHLREDHMGAYRLTEENGAVVIRGKRIEQFTVMTDFKSRGAVTRFRDVMERVGVIRAIKRIRTSEDQPVYIGKVRVDEHV